MPDPDSKSWRSLIRPQDFVWGLLFATLILTAQERDFSEISMLVAFAAVQVLEPKIPALKSTAGRFLWIGLKLALAFLLAGYTGGYTSRYWVLLMLPVVSAASIFGVIGTLVFSLGAVVLAYLSLLLFIDWTQYTLDWPEISELAFRVIVTAMVGNLSSILGQDLRYQSRQSLLSAEQLAEANRHLQAAEEAVRRSDRLAALGQMSAGLAHELRNPLGTVKASAEMLSRSVAAENDVARELAGFISSEVDRVNSLITRFLQFAKPLEIRLDSGDLTQTLDRAIAAAGREVPSVAIYTNYAPEIPPFPFDAELMERVFYNLVVNAAQATAAGGTVTVKTRTADRTVEISVIDRGSGIDPAQMETIFNPFFTTKPQGVGLGLAIVSKIVDRHGGKIAVESEPGKGSVFRVLLPMQLAGPGSKT